MMSDLLLVSIPAPGRVNACVATASSRHVAASLRQVRPGLAERLRFGWFQGKVGVRFVGDGRKYMKIML
jgi:hypothetical protein